VSQCDIQCTGSVAAAKAVTRAVALRRCAVLRILAKVVLRLSVEAAQVPRQEVADAVRSTHRAFGPGDDRDDVLVGSHAIQAVRVEQCQVPELRDVVSTQAQLAEGARKADRGTTVESQPLAACGSGPDTGRLVV
jgi:hypothetical protein